MNRIIWIAGAIALAGLGVSGCGGGSSTVGTVSAPPLTTQEYDTANVLELAQATSETAAPFAVNGDAVTITGTSDTSEPISINGM